MVYCVMIIYVQHPMSDILEIDWWLHELSLQMLARDRKRNISVQRGNSRQNQW